MSRRPRATGFTRFLLAMLIIVPIAYLIASYTNGEDGIQNIKEAVGLATPAENELEDAATNDELMQRLRANEQKIEDLERENVRLRRMMEQ